jgi:hypothetical protein
VPISLPPGSPCQATSAGDAPHVAAGSAQAFAERASKAYCDGSGEAYRSTTTLRLAPAR